MERCVMHDDSLYGPATFRVFVRQRGCKWVTTRTPAIGGRARSVAPVRVVAGSRGTEG